MLSYEIGDGQMTITDCNRHAKGELVIPNEIEGLPVTSIMRGSLYGCSSLTSITIPKAFHSEDEASRLGLGELWPDGFALPDSSSK